MSKKDKNQKKLDLMSQPLQPGELYLKKCIEIADYQKRYKKNKMITIVSLVIAIVCFILAVFVKSIGEVLKGFAYGIGIISVAMVIIFLIATIKASGPAKDLKKTSIYKRLDKRMNFRSEEDFFKLDEMISRDIVENTLYSYPKTLQGGGSIITNNYIILNAYGADPSIYEISKALLFTGYTYTVSSRYTTTTYYSIKLYTSDEVGSVFVGSNLIQQEEGMNMAIIARILFAPDDAGFQQLFKKQREKFIADATRERRILYSNLETSNGINEAFANAQNNLNNGVLGGGVSFGDSANGSMQNTVPMQTPAETTEPSQEISMSDVFNSSDKN